MNSRACGVLSAWLLLLTTVVAAEQGVAKYEEADRRVPRLPPSAFPRLPPAVRSDMERRGCTVPQVWTGGTPHNVIRGQFFKAGQQDWAVLCSVRRVSTILVYPGGSPSGVADLVRAADMQWMQDVGEGQIGYSRSIAAVGRDYILSHNVGRMDVGRIDHDGINDAFVEKGSDIWYFRSGRWLKFAGAD